MRGERKGEAERQTDRHNMKDRYLVFAYLSGDYIWGMRRERQSIWFINKDSCLQSFFPER